MNIFKKALRKVQFLNKRAQLHQSWKKHRFDEWHVENNIYNRPYKFQLAKLLSKLKLDSVIEVGCGFGEILVHTKANRKIGYDIDPKVIAAASDMYGDVLFKVGGIDDISEKAFDCLVLFNWIHNISESELENSIGGHIGKMKYLIVDQVKKGTKGYLYYHSFDFLNSNFTHVDTVSAEQDIRNILIYKSNS